jgi:aerobic-type carbon monoxide dehydrogenase small subunit (CoxS/CutS family)
MAQVLLSSDAVFCAACSVEKHSKAHRACFLLVPLYRGSNVIEVQLPDGEESLAILPTRFRKLIWVKRGDYLLVSSSSGEIETCK